VILAGRSGFSLIKIKQNTKGTVVTIAEIKSKLVRLFYDSLYQCIIT